MGLELSPILRRVSWSHRKVSSEEEAEQRKLQEANQHEKPFGKPSFLEKMGQILRLDFTIKQRGRPRRHELSTIK